MEGYLPRNLGLELVRATEDAAIIAGRWMGLGKAEEADRAAAKAMSNVLNTVRMRGVITVVEEHNRGHDSGLKAQKLTGTGEGVLVDLVLDPIDGRTQLAKGHPGAISAAAVAPSDSIWRAESAIYMEKIVVDEQVAPYLVAECMDAPAAWTLGLVARVKDIPVSNLRVFILDRPRHADLIEEIRATGAHIVLRRDGDITGALMVCTQGGGVDVLMGTGGIAEGLLAACAIKALGGAMLSRLDPQSDAERLDVINEGKDLNSIFTIDNFVTSDQVFFAATGITDGPLLSGVVYYGNRAESNSIILRSETRTRRRIFAEHLIEGDDIE